MKNMKAHLRLLATQATGIGAGAIFVALDTGRVLLVKRSPECDSPNTWCCLGGGVEHGETIEQGLLREAYEEGGFDAPCKLVPFYKSVSPDFTYHNYVAVVDKEFDPTLNHEHTDYGWFDTSELPSPLHPKFAEALRSKNGRAILEALI